MYREGWYETLSLCQYVSLWICSSPPFHWSSHQKTWLHVMHSTSPELAACLGTLGAKLYLDQYLIWAGLKLTMRNNSPAIKQMEVNLLLFPTNHLGSNQNSPCCLWACRWWNCRHHQLHKADRYSWSQTPFYGETGIVWELEFPVNQVPLQ